MCKILRKEVKFEFDGDCVREFNFLNEKLELEPIIISQNWSQSFKLLCDVSGLV